MKLAHIALWTEDLERSREFYEKYFNAQSNERYQNEKKGFLSYFLRFENEAQLELMHMPGVARCQQKKGEQRMGLIHIAFSTGSRRGVDELTKELRRDGYSVVGAPRTTGDGYYESVILDPDGNLVEITD
jgi:lactoylglutathione lyase